MINVLPPSTLPVQGSAVPSNSGLLGSLGSYLSPVAGVSAVASGIAGMINTIKDIFTPWNQSKEYKQAMALQSQNMQNQRDLYNFQFDRQLDLMNRQNEYNSFSNQRKMAEEAGYNPASLFGGSYSPASSATPGSINLPSGNLPVMQLAQDAGSRIAAGLQSIQDNALRIMSAIDNSRYVNARSVGEEQLNGNVEIPVVEEDKDSSSGFSYGVKSIPARHANAISQGYGLQAKEYQGRSAYRDFWFIHRNQSDYFNAMKSRWMQDVLDRQLMRQETELNKLKLSINNLALQLTERTLEKQINLFDTQVDFYKAQYERYQDQLPARLKDIMSLLMGASSAFGNMSSGGARIAKLFVK